MEVLKDPVFIPRYNVSLEQTRDEAYKILSKVTSSDLVSVTNFINDPTNIFTAHEFLG